MARVNSRLAPRVRVTNGFWYRSKTLESDFPLTKLARYSTLSLRPRNMAPVWDFVSAEPLLRPTVAGSGLRTTLLAERVFISRWLSRRTPEAWTPGATDPLREFGFADRAFSSVSPTQLNERELFRRPRDFQTFTSD